MAHNFILNTVNLIISFKMIQIATKFIPASFQSQKIYAELHFKNAVQDAEFHFKTQNFNLVNSSDQSFEANLGM